MIKKLFIIIAALLFIQATVSARLIEAENEYIKVIGVPVTGGFIVKTVAGDPELESDQEKLWDRLPENLNDLLSKPPGSKDSGLGSFYWGEGTRKKRFGIF